MIDVAESHSRPDFATEMSSAAKPGSLRISADNSLHNASTRALSALLNMSEIMVAPPAIHCPEPPNSGWLNCAMLPRPAIPESPSGNILNRRNHL